MAKCPLARIGREGTCDCWEEQCKWWVKTVGGSGDCSILTTMLTLNSYLNTLHVYQAEKMSGPVEEPKPPSGPEDLAGRYGIDPNRWRL